MNSPEKNMITDWLKENGNPEIEIQVLNEVVDKLVEERDTLLKQRDEFAIEFGDWVGKNTITYHNGKFRMKTLTPVFRTSEQLLERFKEEKGL